MAQQYIIIRNGYDRIKVSTKYNSQLGLMFYSRNAEYSLGGLLMINIYVPSFGEDLDIDHETIFLSTTYNRLCNIEIIKYPSELLNIHPAVKQITIDYFISHANKFNNLKLTKNDPDIIELFEMVWEFLRI